MIHDKVGERWNSRISSGDQEEASGLGCNYGLYGFSSLKYSTSGSFTGTQLISCHGCFSKAGS